MAITLRRATADDCRRLFEWRNLPELVARASHQNTVTWVEHQQWFARVSLSKECLLLIICEEMEPIGQLRFELDTPASVKVSIYLRPDRFGHGFGTAALVHGDCMAFEEWPHLRQIDALIRSDNQPSIRAFEKAGYRQVENNVLPNHVCMRLLRAPLGATV